MSWEAWTTLSMLGGVFTLMACTRIAPDVILCAVVTLLVTLRILTPTEALAGLANEGMVTVGLLFIVAAGLRETGGMHLLTQRMLGQPRSLRAAQVRLTVPVAAMSAFLNNTPLVAMLLPVVDEWARQQRLSVSKLMMPLSYATILGGTCSLIGTSTNLVVNGLLSRTADLPSLHMFEIAWVGIPCALVGLAYLLLTSRWLLPERRPALSIQDDPREYTVEMQVEAESPLVSLTDLAEDLGRKHGGWYDFARDYCFVDGNWVATYWLFGTFPGLYNKSHFDAVGLQAPETWEDLLKADRSPKPELPDLPVERSGARGGLNACARPSLPARCRALPGLDHGVWRVPHLGRHPFPERHRGRV